MSKHFGADKMPGKKCPFCRQYFLLPLLAQHIRSEECIDMVPSDDYRELRKMNPKTGKIHILGHVERTVLTRTAKQMRSKRS